MNQNEFISLLKDLVEYARAKENMLTKKEVSDYFEDMKLSKEQMESVYQYLKENNIDISGQKKTASADKPLNREDSAYLKVYRKEIRMIDEHTEDEIFLMYEQLAAGEENVKDTLIEAHLKKVVSIATKYKNKGVLLEDLIQEGNLTLIMMIHSFYGNCQAENVKKQIEKGIRARMIELCDEALENDGRENTILAKTNLIHEATKVLAEDLGRVGNIHELSEYTKMTENEILEIVELSVDKIEIGACDHEHGHHEG